MKQEIDIKKCVSLCVGMGFTFVNSLLGVFFFSCFYFWFLGNALLLLIV